MKRGENAELATVAGLLHDVETYATLHSEQHAHRDAYRSID